MVGFKRYTGLATLYNSAMPGPLTPKHKFSLSRLIFIVSVSYLILSYYLILSDLILLSYLISYLILSIYLIDVAIYLSLSSSIDVGHIG